MLSSHVGWPASVSHGNQASADAANLRHFVTVTQPAGNKANCPGWAQLLSVTSKTSLGENLQQPPVSLSREFYEAMRQVAFNVRSKNLPY
jgi:hypothetical protein